jgi:hypothetical protein
VQLPAAYQHPGVLYMHWPSLSYAILLLLLLLLVVCFMCGRGTWLLTIHRCCAHSLHKLRPQLCQLVIQGQAGQMGSGHC